MRPMLDPKRDLAGATLRARRPRRWMTTNEGPRRAVNGNKWRLDL